MTPTSPVAAAPTATPPLQTASTPVSGGNAVNVVIQNPSFNAGADGLIALWSPVEHNTGNSYTFTVDNNAPYSAPSSARIHRYGLEDYGLLDQLVRTQPTWASKTARLSGALKTDNANDGGGALVIQTRLGDGSILTSNHMEDGRVKGTTAWKLYSVDVKIPNNAYHIRIGAMLDGGGTLWVDDLKLEIIN
jgi:hypothetical protein